MMWLLDWRYLTSEQFYMTHHSPLVHYCRKWYDQYDENHRVLHENCTNVWPAYLATITKLDHAMERITHIMEKEIPVVVPNFELKPLEPEPTTIVYPEFETKTHIETRSLAYQNTRKKKRFIADLICLGVQGFTAFNTNRKVNQLKKGMKKLFEK